MIRYATTQFIDVTTLTVTVDTMNDLDALTWRPKSVVVLGFYAAGDGGGGTFYWNEGDATTVLRGLVNSPTGTPLGRYRRQFNGPVDLFWIGATGDGVTVDDVIINAALTWGNSNSVSSWYASPPSVFYNCTSPLALWPQSNFLGAGYDSLFKFTDCHGIVMADPGAGSAFIKISGVHLVGNADTSNTYFTITDISQGTAINISAITNADPGEVTTATPHGLSTDAVVIFASVGGMTELNGNTYQVTVVDATHFTIGVDTTNYGTYTSGGTETECGVVTTSTANGFATGDIVFINAVVGMTEVNRVVFTITVLTATTFSLNVDTSGYTAYSSGGTVAFVTFGIYVISTRDSEINDYVIENFVEGIVVGFDSSNAPHRLVVGGLGYISQNDDANYFTGYPQKAIHMTGSGGRGQSQAVTLTGLYAQARSQGRETNQAGDGINDTFDFDFSTSGRGLFKQTGIQVRVLDAATNTVWVDSVITTDYRLYALTSGGSVAGEITAGMIEVSSYANGSVGAFAFSVNKVRVVFEPGSIPPAPIVAGVKNVQIHWADPTGDQGIAIDDGNGMSLRPQTIGGYDTSAYINDGPNEVIILHNINSRRAGYLSENAAESICYVIHPQYGTMQAGTTVEVQTQARRALVSPGINHEAVYAQMTTTQPTQPFTSNNFTTVAWDSPGENLADAPDYTSGLTVTKGAVICGLYTMYARQVELWMSYQLTLTDPTSTWHMILEVSFDNWASATTLRNETIGNITQVGVGPIEDVLKWDLRDPTTKTRAGNRMWTAAYRVSVKCDSAGGSETLAIISARMRVSEVQPS